MLDVIYFSSVSNMTHRFVQKLDVASQRLPLRRGDAEVLAQHPFLLITPTYGNGSAHGAVPKQVIRFLNNPGNRTLLQGVVAAGNRNFGSGYALAGPIIARKCQVPHRGSFELMGTPEDVAHVQNLLSTSELKPAQ